MANKRQGRTKQAHWRVSPEIYEVLENRASECGTSVAHQANEVLHMMLQDELAALAVAKKSNGS